MDKYDIFVNNVLKQINEIRKQKNITIDKIATQLGKDKSVISRILKGSYKLDLETYLRMCDTIKSDSIKILNNAIDDSRVCIVYKTENKKILSDFFDYIKNNS